MEHFLKSVDVVWNNPYFWYMDVHTDKRTAILMWPSDHDQEYLYFIGTEILCPICYIIFNLRLTSIKMC